MSTDRPDDAALVAEVVARLVRVRSRLGVRAFRHAVDHALNGIGRAALIEAERRAGRVQASGRSRRKSNVVPFPLATQATEAPDA